MAADVTVGLMQPLVGQRFNLIGHDVSLELVEVDEPKQLDDNLQLFTLLFEGPTDALLWQDTWALSHPSCDIEVFLVPVGPRSDEQRVRYESVISRVV